VRTADFNYELPQELIAQHPAPDRSASRLLVLHRKNGLIEHRTFPDLLNYLNPGDCLVVNNSKVIPARLRAMRPGSGGMAELLLVEEVSTNHWWAMVRPGKRLRVGSTVELLKKNGGKCGITGEFVKKNEEGHALVRFHDTPDIKNNLAELGEIPLPPYIERSEGTLPLDQERYQTVYARPQGSVAAPTAGLHFTPEILGELAARQILRAEVTLHVGLGTFSPVKVESLEQHKMHEERFELQPDDAELINQTKARGGRVVAVGTTSLRVLESIAQMRGKVEPLAGRTRLFVYPPCEFRVVDALLTNFHLPHSTLLMLVSAFAAPGKTEGREMVLRAYSEAVRNRYRFFSYGDAMLLL
jgi:S-adenosylmethionine:tRNA ribosyltransferase-isomerase